MTDRTTIKLEITAFDDHATATYRVNATSKDNPAASVAALVSLMERYGWVEEKLDVPAFAPTATIEGLPEPRPSTYRERLAEVSGLDPCELDISESEAPRPNATPDIDTDKASGYIVCAWANVCTDVEALRRAIDREQARKHASPPKAVRASVIAACEARLCEINGAQA
jgi:hypothetical protein